jgi:uncharacterized protein
MKSVLKNTPRLLARPLQDSPKSVLLLGPRQVGKSTLIRSLDPDLMINLNDEREFLNFKSNPGELKERLHHLKNVRTIFIDEIQRHPSLLNTIQTLIDDPQLDFKFLITGSSARKLKRGQANLLPGRLLTYELGPLCSAELEYTLDSQKALRYGCLPEPYLLSEPPLIEKILLSYAGTYLKEEIQAEALTRDLSGFSRFLLTSATTSGLILDFSKIAKQAKIERKACSRFYEILEDTLIARRVEVYDRTQAEIVRRPKYYFFDTGVLNGLLENFIASDDRKGVLFEHLVHNQIRASAQARDLAVKIHYFRTRAGFEVDFVVEIKNKIYAIEVKSGKVNDTDVRTLERFADYERAIAGFFVVTLEGARRQISNTVICGVSEMLQAIGL